MVFHGVLLVPHGILFSVEGTLINYFGINEISNGILMFVYRFS